MENMLLVEELNSAAIEVDESTIIDEIYKEMARQGTSAHKVSIRLMKKDLSTHASFVQNLKTRLDKKNCVRFYFKSVSDIVKELGGVICINWKEKGGVNESN